jgi:hypothetical protein
VENAIQTAKKSRFSDALDGVTLYSRFFAKTVIRPVAVIEVVGYMGAAIGVFYLINPQDPLLLLLAYPWIWLVATALALRYGALMGVLAGLMIVLAWEILYRGYQGNGALSFPVMFMSGGLVQVILAGHVRDVWSNLLVRANGINGYLNDHLASLTTAHYLLRVSHDRLERDLFTRPATLRSALEHMREITALSTEAGEPDSPFKGAQAALDLISMICQLGSATLYAVASNGQVVDVAHAAVGTPIPLNRNDPVLKDCLTRQSLSHLKAVDAEKLGSYYVAAPIVQVSGELIGVLLVHQIHFMALNHDNMQLMRVLLDYYGDGLAQHQLVGQVHRLMPQCPYGFSAELERISHLKKLYDIDSSLVALSFPRSGPGDLQFQQVNRQLRSLDMLWTDQNDERQFSLFLMPLTEGDGVLGYMNRIEAGLQQTFQTTLAEAEIRFYSTSIKPRDADKDLKMIYDQVRAA